MLSSRFIAAALGAVLLTGTAASALAQPASGGAAYQQTEQQGRHAHFLTPEQRIMWYRQHRDEMKSMSPEQRHAYRQQLHQQFLAMTPAQKAQMRDQLQAQWNQLPQERRQTIEQRIAERQQQHHYVLQGGRQSGDANGQSGQRAYPQASAGQD